MRKKILIWLFISALTFWNCVLQAEDYISLKLCYASNNTAPSDVNAWVNSFNLLWSDWQQANGGQLQGGFTPLDYSGGLEIELRIPILAGFALNMAGSGLTSSEEGRVEFSNQSTDLNESQFISNKVSAVPLKIGFSYTHPLPYLHGLYITAQAGRHIIFYHYDLQDRYNAEIVRGSNIYEYWYEKNQSFKSEALGYYISLGVEFDIIRYAAVVLEGEQVWSTADGFKGAHTYQGSLGDGPFSESGKASLYFYESNRWELGQYYSVLTGHQRPPEDPNIRGLRQGELEFNNFSIKCGIRFKF
jgi:hypothetical protein